MVDARTALGVVTLTCALALTGCTPDEPAGPTPSPSPVAQTPSETPQERQERLDYAAAEKSYRTFRAEYNRVLRAGGAKKPTKIMKATAGGPYLAELGDVVRAYAGTGARNRGLERIEYVQPAGHEDTSLILDICEDGRRITTLTSEEAVPGEIRFARLEIHKIGRVWKVWAGDGQKVTTCP